MPDYQQMYKTLFQAITRTIDILQKAQQETEELYISADEPILTLWGNESNVSINNDSDAMEDIR